MNGVRATIVRLFNTYGPKMRLDDGRVIPELLGNALAGRPLVLHGSGSQTRSFCYVSDLVRGLLLVGLDDLNDGEIFNIGNPSEITIRGLAERIRDLIDSGLRSSRPTLGSATRHDVARTSRRSRRAMAGNPTSTLMPAYERRSPPWPGRRRGLTLAPTETVSADHIR